MTFDKAGETLTTKKLHGSGRIMKECKCAACRQAKKEGFAPFYTLPCGCEHTLVHQCTCKLRDHQCRKCKRIFVACGKDWYEVEDPHKRILP